MTGWFCSTYRQERVTTIHVIYETNHRMVSRQKYSIIDLATPQLYRKPIGVLHWFMLHPEARGKGLGKKLLQEAINYCKERGFKFIFLETTGDQHTAIGMYQKAGFKKISEQEVESWGKRLIEQTFELRIHS